MPIPVPAIPAPLAISDYALIGDCRSAALISCDGSIDWLCLPRFDSPSIFGALLDTDKGGRFRVRPAGPFAVERRYIPETNVLEITFRTPSGVCILRDLMPVSSEEEKRRKLVPEHQILREIEGLEGEVELEIDYAPRPDYGRSRPALKDRGALGIWCEWDGAAFILRSEAPLRLADGNSTAHGTTRIRPGERKFLSFSYCGEAPAVIPQFGAVAEAQRERSIRWWQEWAGRCTYWGPYREAVVRSALVLKLLAYAPSGAIVAAPTTSLPENPGGVRNWDYRYCWLRDASFTLRSLLHLGYAEEAEAFLSWVLHATALTWPELQVVYDVFGEADLPERELLHLSGYAGSRPVRTGNNAHGQFQLDVYGEVIDAVAQFGRHGGHLDRDTVKLLDGLGRAVCKRWQERDEGIWEGRSGRYHYTHSKVLCWVALDRLVDMHEAGQIAISVDMFRKHRDAIRAEVEAHGYDRELQSYTRTFDGQEMDASLLTLPLYGYIEATDPQMRSTYARIQERLASGRLLYRYEADTDDGLPPGEAAFGICSFWAAECLARSGDRAGAIAAFEELLTYGNDLGLFAEEIEPGSGAALGNFPQGFTHVGLINAALTLVDDSEMRMAVSEKRHERQPAVEDEV